MKQIEYKINAKIESDAIIALYKDCGLPRPIDDKDRIATMFANSNLVVSAWSGNELVGISRTLTDFVWSSYLADLAVRSDFQKEGLGRKLVEITREKVSEQSMVLLLSVPDAMDYYPKIGMTKVESAFIFNRKN
jgi:ribosomal protein S18 acetylase RimI-like enzyme